MIQDSMTKGTQKTKNSDPNRSHEISLNFRIKKVTKNICEPEKSFV